MISRLLRRRSPPFTPEQVLAAQPMRNPLVEWTRDEAGLVTVTIRRRSDIKTRLLSWLVSIPQQRQISLDDLGSDVWEMCDGELSLREMTKRFARKNKLNIKEAEQSLLKFLNDLAGRGLVGFRVSPTAEPDPAKPRNAAGEQKSK